MKTSQQSRRSEDMNVISDTVNDLSVSTTGLEN